MADDEELRRLIEHYFNLGYQSKVIIEFLKKHDISISLATLKRRLQDYGLSRRGQAIDDQQLREVIRCEISGPGELMGYRAVWHSLRNSAISFLLKLLIDISNYNDWVYTMSSVLNDCIGFELVWTVFKNYKHISILATTIIVGS